MGENLEQYAKEHGWQGDSNKQTHEHFHYQVKTSDHQVGESFEGDLSGQIKTIQYTRKVSDNNYGSFAFAAFMELNPDADVDSAADQLKAYVTNALRKTVENPDGLTPPIRRG